MNVLGGKKITSKAFVSTHPRSISPRSPEMKPCSPAQTPSRSKPTPKGLRPGVLCYTNTQPQPINWSWFNRITGLSTGLLTPRTPLLTRGEDAADKRLPFWRLQVLSIWLPLLFHKMDNVDLMNKKSLQGHLLLETQKSIAQLVLTTCHVPNSVFFFLSFSFSSLSPFSATIFSSFFP